MPFAPKKPCARRGCGALVDAGYCPACASKQSAIRDRDRGTSTERGYGYRWQKASKAFLRTHPIAVDYFGEHNGRVFPAEVVDHIIPHCGDMALFWSVSNWQPMTKAEHDRKTALEDGSFGHVRKSS
jgi:5-methylcytosine-specific restriction enzyme A